MSSYLSNIATLFLDVNLFLMVVLEEMGTRIDNLEKNVTELMTEAGMEEEAMSKWYCAHCGSSSPPKKMVLCDQDLSMKSEIFQWVETLLLAFTHVHNILFILLPFPHFRSYFRLCLLSVKATFDWCRSRPLSLNADTTSFLLIALLTCSFFIDIYCQ